MSELDRTLNQLTLEQHLLAAVFLLGYGTALGSMFGPIGRRRALLLAMLAAVGFAALTHPWEHGVLLVLCAIGGVGLFIAVASAFSAIAALDRRVATPPNSFRAGGSSPDLRDAAAQAVARAAHAVKRRRRHRTT